jgi:hypothetical protein
MSHDYGQAGRSGSHRSTSRRISGGEEFPLLCGDKDLRHVDPIPTFAGESPVLSVVKVGVVWCEADKIHGLERLG